MQSNSALRILFVEDEASLVEAVVAQLSRRGYEVLVATEADRALEIIQQEKTIDVLITDLQIPVGKSGTIGFHEIGAAGLPGMVVAHEFRRTFRRAPIVVWSSHASYEVVEEIRKLGQSRFLSKRSGDIMDYLDAMLGGFRSSNRPRIFIVHGHDDVTMRELEQYIVNDLKFPPPVILRNEASANLTTIEKLERHVDRTDLVFVLLTPDDEAVDKNGDKEFRARQNVLFELGYFLGVLGRNTSRVIILYRDPVSLPSDITGIICIDISNGVKEVGSEISRELIEWL